MFIIIIIIIWVYLIGITFKHILIGLGPEVNLDTTSGVRIFTTNIAVFNIIKSSLGTPASTSFKLVNEFLAAENPT